jgi:hypothetical protein
LLDFDPRPQEKDKHCFMLCRGALKSASKLIVWFCEQGIQTVKCFRCRDVYVYVMGQEPWLNCRMSIKYTDQSRPIVESNKLIKACQEQGIVAERLFGDKEICLKPE